MRKKVFFELTTPQYFIDNSCFFEHLSAHYYCFDLKQWFVKFKKCNTAALPPKKGEMDA